MTSSSSHAAAASRAVQTSGRDRVALHTLARSGTDDATRAAAMRRHGTKLALALVNAAETSARAEDKTKGLAALGHLAAVTTPR